MEPEEGIEKVTDALKTCKLYQDTYHSHRNKLMTYFKEEPVVEWDFESSLLFTRLNKFTYRLEIIEVGTVSGGKR